MTRSLLLLATAITLVATLMFTPSARAEYSLTILHFNDMHSRFEPINKYDSACRKADDAAGKCFGGAARLKTAIDTRRNAVSKAGGNVLTLIAGDLFQGSLFFTKYRGTMNANIMNLIGIDAMALGNHEFDYGPDALLAFAKKVKFPLVAANIDFSKLPDLEENVSPFIIVEPGEEKVAIIGLTTPDTVEIASPGPDVKFYREEEVLPEIISKLQSDGINKIILLTHSGFDRDVEIAKAVAGVDLIVGGHSNTLPKKYPTVVSGPDGKPVRIVQAYAYGKFLGEITLTFNEAGDVNKARGRPWLLSGVIPADGLISDHIESAAGPLKTIKEKVVGNALAEIDGKRSSCRVNVCAMGVLVAEAMLDRVKEQGIQIAIQNGGGLRASIDAGPITMGEVLTVLPFQNTLSTFQLKGEDVRVALENGLSQFEKTAGRFPQVAGLKFTWNASAAPGNRVKSIEVRTADGAFSPLDPEAMYGVVSNNFMRGGGDGYDIFKTNARNAYDYGPNLENVLAGFLKVRGDYEPAIDDRITRLD